MTKEQEQIIDEEYALYLNESRIYNYPESFIVSKEEFINKCKTDTEFSEKWGLKIEERELSLVERMEYYGKHFMKETESKTFDELLKVNYDELNIPTKQLTLTYKDEKIETYE
jgi:hypothetical protein